TRPNGPYIFRPKWYCLNPVCDLQYVLFYTLSHVIIRWVKLFTFFSESQFWLSYGAPQVRSLRKMKCHHDRKTRPDYYDMFPGNSVIPGTALRPLSNNAFLPQGTAPLRAPINAGQLRLQ
ncbi:unnamed protein product, partial [Laminaria digitata]